MFHVNLILHSSCRRPVALDDVFVSKLAGLPSFPASIEADVVRQMCTSLACVAYCR